MSILEEIIQEKHREIAVSQVEFPLAAVKAQALQSSSPRGFTLALTNHKTPAIIAEIKRASPSKGLIREDLDPISVAQEFAAAGAACLSVLTDRKFFQGHLDFLKKIRAAGVAIPILRKDFIVDEYQLYESRAAGADAILLIVAALAPDKLKELYLKALELNLDVLMEVHTEEELGVALALLSVSNPGTARSILGINNRNLKSFVTELSTTGELIAAIPKLIKGSKLQPLPASVPVISESGIYSAQDIVGLIKEGAQGFLIGESLVKVGSPGENLSQLISETQSLITQSGK